jgi:hypothetical protein
MLQSYKQDAMLQEYGTLIWSHANVLYSIKFDEDNYQSIRTGNVYVIGYKDEGIENTYTNFPVQKNLYRNYFCRLW